MRIGVVGLGLIGGSIFKNLRESKKYEVIGISRTVDEFNVSKDYSNLSSCDVIFVCTPMNKTLEILDKIEEFVNKDTIVTDVCSLKEFVSHKDYKYKFIPSHPMAGTEHRGWEHSFPDMFHGASWALTPKENTDDKDIEVLKSIIERMGAEIIFTTPKEHDKAVALISHAPMVVAQAFCKNILDNQLAQKLASSGFKDTTRLAMSNVEMANDMVFMNEENIKNAVDELNKNIKILMSGNYRDEASTVKQFRENLYSK